MESYVGAFMAQLALAWAAPAVVLPLVVLVATATWAVRGAFEDSAKQGLKEQNEALKANLALAKEGSPEVKKEIEAMGAAFRQEVDSVKGEVERLKGQIQSGATREEMAAAANALDAQIAALDLSNFESELWRAAKSLDMQLPETLKQPPHIYAKVSLRKSK